MSARQRSAPARRTAPRPGTKPLSEPDYTIRPARPGDLRLLPPIEDAAGELFAEFGVAEEGEVAARSIPVLSAAQRDGRLWVAAGSDDVAVGFAMAEIVDGGAHLEELDVHPDHGRRGLGARLVAVVCDWAAQAGHDAITLSTMRDVPFNAPWYARLGFRILDWHELTPGLLRLREAERRTGLAVDERVFMRRSL